MPVSKGNSVIFSGGDGGGGSDPVPTRKKTEVFWSGLTGQTLISDTDVNLVDFLKNLPPPDFGTLEPFFNVTSNKLNVFNDDVSLFFKLNLQGSWSGSSIRRSIQIDFLGTTGNRLVASRDQEVDLDVITLGEFFSVDKDGTLVTSGSTPIIRSNNGTFTFDAILLIAEQVTTQTEISAA